MNKKIFFSLFLSLPALSFCMDFSKYSEDTAKKLISHFADDQNIGHVNIAIAWATKGNNFQKISNTLENLFAIAADPQRAFTQDDLKDEWYVNATNIITTQFNHTSIQDKPYTLLSLSMKNKIQLDKIIQLVAAGSNCKKDINNKLLLDIALKRAKTKNQVKKNQYWAIAKLLLNNNADPNYQVISYNKEESHLYISPTPLMLAAFYNDKAYMNLLLCNKACSLYPDIAQQCKNNEGYWYDHYGFEPRRIFDMQTGQPQGILKETIMNMQ